VQRVADVAREMDVGGGDQRAVGIRLDRDDALERMLRPLLRLPVPDEVLDLVAVGGKELALERPRAPRNRSLMRWQAGQVAAAAPAGASPRSTPAVVHGAALRAARLGELLADLVGVVDQLVASSSRRIIRQPPRSVFMLFLSEAVINATSAPGRSSTRASSG
jgi:hypothetical protein